MAALRCRGRKCGDLDDEHLSRLGGQELREGDSVAEAERAHRVDGDTARRLEQGGIELGRVEMRPADTEARTGGT